MKSRFYFVFLFLLPFTFQAQKPALPEFEVSVSDPQFSAYYFFSPLKVSPAGNSLPINIILDHKGEIVYYKKFAKGPYSGSFRLHPNGLLSYYFDGNFFLMDSTLTVIDSITCKNGILLDSHDFLILPNGHYLMLGYEYIQMDLSSYLYFNKKNSPGSKTAKVKCDVIQELDAKKRVVFEWHGKDHYTFSDVNPLYLNNPNDVDWMHFNAVEDDGEGNLLISSKYLDEITKIKRSTGEIVWRLGGKKNQFTFTNDILMFKGQHDIRATGRNTITLFDNGLPGFPVHPETAKEYLLDEKLMTAKLIWKHINNSEAYSSGYGNVQRLTDDLTLVNYGRSEQSTTLFNVVNASGRKFFEILSKDSLINYRAFAYEKLPWGIKRPIINSYTKNGQQFLDAGKGYQNYRWSDGQTGQVIKVSQPGIYTVFTELKQGGVLVSSKFIVKNGG